MLDNLNKITTLQTNYSYLQSLNYDQQIAATTITHNSLVLGGPGTGKTHTLVYRALHLINQGVNPENIVLITFTRKAANHLKQRVKTEISDVKLGFIGTFHALATSILSDANHLSSWRLIAPNDDLSLIELTCKSGDIGAKRLQHVFSYFANTKKTMDEVLTTLNLTEFLDYSHKIEEAYNFYCKTKRRLSYLNYDDLLINIIDNPNLVRNLKIKYLMIDEFQDVSKLQIDFIKCLNPNNVMAIGDDFQNIYRFRGSDKSILLNFDKYFENANLITLSINYRSSVNISACVNKIVKQTNFSYPKFIVANDTTIHSEDSVKIYNGLDDSTNVIINTIKSNPTEKHTVLYRRTKMVGKLERELIRNNIPYEILGGLNLFERKHIKHLLSIICLINEPNDYLAHINVLMLDDSITKDKAIKLINNLIVGVDNDIITNELLSFKLKTVEQVIDLAIDYYFKQLPDNIANRTINSDFEIIRDLASGYQKIIYFLNDFSLDYKVDFQTNENLNANVILSTIHASKGLEFDNVHILYGFNKFRELELDKIEDEARLFYVATSRAKHSLNIYDNFSKTRSLNDLINDFLDSPLYDTMDLKYDDDDISDVTKVTLHLDQDDLNDNIDSDNLNLSVKSLFDYFKK